MGYSISQEQHERLERNRRNGRLCGFSTGRGGCFTAASVAHLTRSWPYSIGEDTPRISTQVFCTTHGRECAGTGVNFETLATAQLPAKRCPHCGSTDTQAIADVGYDYSDASTDQLGFEHGSPVLDVLGHCRDCGERY